MVKKVGQPFVKKTYLLTMVPVFYQTLLENSLSAKDYHPIPFYPSFKLEGRRVCNYSGECPNLVQELPLVCIGFLYLVKTKIFRIS